MFDPVRQGLASGNTVSMASSGTRCCRPAAAVAVLCKDPNSSGDLLVQVKQGKAAEPIVLGLSSLDRFQAHMHFKPERTSLEKLPNSRII